MIELSVDFDGANPRQADQVERLGDARFRIRPYSEDGDGNYKFAMLVGVRNRSRRAVEAEFVIDWADTNYMSCRDYVLLGRQDQWRYFPAETEGPTARARVTVPPGRHELTLHPTYGLDRLEAWRKRTGTDPLLSVRELGRSRQGRPILAFELGDEPRNAGGGCDRLAIVARFHPYETAGSFAAEGALRFLLRSAAAGKLSGRPVSLVLIANPDGVAGGLCKRAGPGGPDISHQTRSSDDPTVAAMRTWVDQFAPAVMLDLHGWMYHYQDGFNFADPALAERLKRALQRSVPLDRAWKGKDLSGQGESDSLSSYALTRAGTHSLIFSFGWYGRTVAHMRAIGAAVVATLQRCRS